MEPTSFLPCTVSSTMVPVMNCNEPCLQAPCTVSIPFLYKKSKYNEGIGTWLREKYFERRCTKKLLSQKPPQSEAINN